MAIDFSKSDDYLEIDDEKILKEELFLWNVCLTTAEIDLIAGGADPRTIRPDRLVKDKEEKNGYISN